jgi:hypothetical protein
MKRFPILGTLLLFPAVAMFSMVGCNKDATTPAAKTTTVAAKTTEPTGDGGAAKEIKAPTDGLVKGFVKFDGAPPIAKDDVEMKKHKEGPLCEAGAAKDPRFVMEQMWFVDKNGGVANVVVSLEPPTGKKYAIEDKVRDSFKDKKVFIDQPYCAYTPHVIALYAPVQPLVVKNSGKMTHNTMIIPPGKKLNETINLPIGPGSDWEPKTFKYESGVFDIGCSAHGFMKAKMLTFNHPYFAVTKDDGSFEIANVPTGEELVLYFWHESMDKKKDAKKLTFKAGENTVEEIKIK